MSAGGRADGAVQRADKLLGRLGGSVLRTASRAVARVREEAEDVWAEARSVRDAPSSSKRRSD